MLDDYEEITSPDDPTLGSGGGTDGSRAGGRVYLNAITTNITGRINADGKNADLGAGSGGSIVILGGSMHGAGKVSANGGNSVSGGAGSGGRIFIEVRRKLVAVSYCGVVYRCFSCFI